MYMTYISGKILSGWFSLELFGNPSEDRPFVEIPHGRPWPYWGLKGYTKHLISVLTLKRSLRLLPGRTSGRTLGSSASSFSVEMGFSEIVTVSEATRLAVYVADMMIVNSHQDTTNTRPD